MSMTKCLATLRRRSTLSARSAILSWPRSGRRARAQAAAILARSASVACQEGFPLAGPLGFPNGFLQATSRSPGKSGEVISARSWIVEQGQLQRAAADQLLDLRGAQRGDPVQARRPDVFAQPCGGQHAPVPDQDHARDPEPVLDLGHLGGHGRGVPGVAGEHLDRDRDALRGGQQPVDDLQPAADPVLGVPDGAQRAGPALERGARTRHTAPGCRRPGAGPPAHPRSCSCRAAQPVHRARTGHPRRSRPRRAPRRASWRRSPSRSPRAMASLESGPITCATAIAVTRSRCRDGAGSISSSRPSSRARAQHRGDMPVRQAAGDLECPLQRPRPGRLALQHPGQGVDLGLGPGRQVGQGPVLNLAVFPVAFAQQHGRR